MFKEAAQLEHEIATPFVGGAPDQFATKALATERGALALGVVGVVLGVLLAAGSLDDRSASWWPALPVGLLCATLGVLVTRSLLVRVRARLDADTAAALPFYAEAFAVMIAGLSVLFPPLALVALGLLGYAAWRLFQGILDPENEGRDAEGVVKRLDHVVNGLFHAALAVSVGGVALGSGGGGGGPDDWTATLLQQPLGRLLTVAVGAGVVIIGLFQFYRAYDAKFMEKLKPGEMGPRERTWTRRGGRLGHAARGVVFVLIGAFLVQAALQSDPNEARGLGGALSALAGQPFGPYLLGAVAFGLVCFGLFMFVVARYRRIETG